MTGLLDEIRDIMDRFAAEGYEGYGDDLSVHPKGLVHRPFQNQGFAAPPHARLTPGGAQPSPAAAIRSSSLRCRSSGGQIVSSK